MHPYAELAGPSAVLLCDLLVVVTSLGVTVFGAAATATCYSLDVLCILPRSERVYIRV